MCRVVSASLSPFPSPPSRARCPILFSIKQKTALEKRLDAIGHLQADNVSSLHYASWLAWRAAGTSALQEERRPVATTVSHQSTCNAGSVNKSSHLPPSTSSTEAIVADGGLSTQPHFPIEHQLAVLLPLSLPAVAALLRGLRFALKHPAHV